MPESFEQVDAIFERVVEVEHVPGVAFGVVIGGELVHTRGLGSVHANDAGAATPDADSVFRIASMTKSFTAATALLLRDEGELSLDEPVGTYVPELEGFKGATADSPLITVRHLLTMSSGLPTDDPWGDRLQGMALDRFAELLAGGFEMAWPPGTTFEYSNLGYGIVGRVLSNVSGLEYRDLVRARVLEPMGMLATVYEAGEVPAERLVHGHVRRDETFEDEPFDGYGALASMGGLFSSVRDLSTWVRGFLDAFPARDDPEGPHPLVRASRREMQQIHRAFDPELTWTSADAAPSLAAGGYGFGLFSLHDLPMGYVVAHSGGYPGFGSHMRWHPASGVGIIALGNRTYAPMATPASRALAALVAPLVTARAAPVRVVPWDATDAACADVERLIARWDDDLAARLFAHNVDLDEPLERRRAQLQTLTERHGSLHADNDEPAVSDSPSDRAWWLTGEHGWVHLEILLTPERPPRVQMLTMRSVPDPPAPLVELADRVAELLNRSEPAVSWPDDLVAADRSEDERRDADRALRAAAAMFSPVSRGRATHGDGEGSATFPLDGDRGRLVLDVATGEHGTPVASMLRPDAKRPPASRRA